MGGDLNVGIALQNSLLQRLTFFLAYAGFAMANLAVEVCEFHSVAVEQSKCPDSGSSEIHRKRASDSSATNYCDLRRPELGLTSESDFFQKHLPRIALNEVPW